MLLGARLLRCLGSCCHAGLRCQARGQEVRFRSQSGPRCSGAPPSAPSHLHEEVATVAPRSPIIRGTAAEALGAQVTELVEAFFKATATAVEEVETGDDALDDA